jgi:hypothetical protein
MANRSISKEKKMHNVFSHLRGFMYCEFNGYGDGDGGDSSYGDGDGDGKNNSKTFNIEEANE